jgi:hypothetical protein
MKTLTVIFELLMFECTRIFGYMVLESVFTIYFLFEFVLKGRQ